MNEIFNSSFETGLRVLLVLSSIQPKTATIDRIAAYDFITIYGRDFGVSHINLHGDSNFNFSELASKRASCNEGIKEFVLNGLISINRTQEGFTYFLNDNGKKYVESLSSDYANQYLVGFIRQKTLQKKISFINAQNGVLTLLLHPDIYTGH